MARRRKEDTTNAVGAVEAFLSRCFRDGENRAIQPTFGQEYTLNESIFVFTEEVLDGMLATGRVKVTSRSEKAVNILGVLP